jgi:hypothetical protein
MIMKRRLLLIPILMLILLFSSCGKCEMCFYYVEEVIKAPTCTEDGYGKHKCSVCGDEYEGPIASYGHSFSETIIKVATCSEEGIKDKLCTVCNYKTQENYILEHSFELTSKVEATCETQGNEVKTCKNCNYVDTKIIDA